MTINERIKYLRKKILHLTQEELAPQIKMSRSNLGAIEIGRIVVTDRVKDDICSAFNVNKNWLESGDGGDDNIFIKATPYEKAYNRFGYLIENGSPTKKAALSAILELMYLVPDDTWELVVEQFNQSLKGIEKEGS